MHVLQKIIPFYILARLEMRSGHSQMAGEFVERGLELLRTMSEDDDVGEVQLCEIGALLDAQRGDYDVGFV